MVTISPAEIANFLIELLTVTEVVMNTARV